jgi:UDP-3-O-[3-hydroxymyristoyl] N-acetylglucosamine deacetylase
LTTTIEWAHPLIGRQTGSYDITAGKFASELAPARTFGFLREADALRARGLALGAALESTLVLSEEGLVGGSLRWPDEFVRHKALDAVGDLALAGAPILGAFRSHRGGHRLNALVLKALFADPEAWTMIEAPRYREVRHAELSHRLAAVNFAAERS